MPYPNNDHVLLSIAFSHYAEKARWALAYYGVPYAEHLLLPAWHIPSVRSIPDRPDPAIAQNAQTSPTSTPYLVVYDASSSSVKRTFHDSHDILVYLSDNFSSSERPSLYTSCGPTQLDRIVALEKHYDEVLGVASRAFAYYDMIVLNKWRSTLPFACLGFTNGVGLLQSVLWFVTSPLIGRLLVSRMKCTSTSYQQAMQVCRAEFDEASQLLAKSDYLAGNRLSAADITFAALAYPVLGVGHQEGYQRYPQGTNALSHEGQAFITELRATRAGQHALRLFKEQRDFGSPLPRQKRTLLGLW